MKKMSTRYKYFQDGIITLVFPRSDGVLGGSGNARG